MIHNVMIEPVLNGFVCRVGCQTVVFSSVKELTTQIGLYYSNPDKVTKAYTNNALNKVYQNNQPPVLTQQVLDAPACAGRPC